MFPFAVLIALSVAPAHAVEESHPGISNESSYAEAVLAFNGKKYDQVLAVLDALLIRAPGNIEALELKALALKSKGDDPSSLKTYEDLIKAKPEGESGPYHFESAVILFRQKKNPEAKPHFEQAVLRNFNTPVSRFYLGLIAFSASNNLDAETQFTDVAAHGTDELKVAAHYYLGLLHFQGGYPSGGTHELVAARDGAKALSADSSIGKDIGAAAERALEPMNSAQWFGSLSLLFGYDGNVSSVSSNTAPELVTGDKTVKNILSLSIGRASSPTRIIQWTPSYQLSFNKNYVEKSRPYEFITNVGSLYLTYDPLAVTSFGMKLGGTYMFQNNGLSTTPVQTFDFHPYSLTGEFGPFVKTEPAPHWQMELNLFVKPQSYNGETVSTGASRRSGTALYSRLSARHDTPNRFFSPDAALTYERNNAQGSDYLSRTLTLDLNDTLHVTSKDTATAGLTLARTSYPDKSGLERSDLTYTLHGSWVRTMSPRYSFVGDLGFTHNSSSLDEFTYNKPSFTLGVSFTL